MFKAKFTTNFSNVSFSIPSTFNDILINQIFRPVTAELVCCNQIFTSLWEPSLQISRLGSRWHYPKSLKPVHMGMLIWYKSENPMSQHFCFFFLFIRELVHQYTTAWGHPPRLLSSFSNLSQMCQVFKDV